MLQLQALSFIYWIGVFNNSRLHFLEDEFELHEIIKLKTKSAMLIAHSQPLALVWPQLLSSRVRLGTPCLKRKVSQKGQWATSERPSEHCPCHFCSRDSSLSLFLCRLCIFYFMIPGGWLGCLLVFTYSSVLAYWSFCKDTVTEDPPWLLSIGFPFLPSPFLSFFFFLCLKQEEC